MKRRIVSETMRPAYPLPVPLPPEFPIDNPRGESPLERLLSGRTRTLKAAVNELLDEIQRRENLHERLVDGFDEQLFGQQSRLEQIRGQSLPYDFEFWVQRKKLEQSLEDSVGDLLSERRREMVECWRDVALLKKYLMIALREYWDAARRTEILTDGV